MLLTVLVCGALVSAQQQESPARRQFLVLLDEGQFEQAARFAHRHFKPQWDCEILLYQAERALNKALQLLEQQEQATRQGVRLNKEALNSAQQQLDDAEAHTERATERADKYVAAGMPPALRVQVEEVIKARLGQLPELKARLIRLSESAEPFHVLIGMATIPAEEIQKIKSSALRFITGLHLAERGQFDRATEDCFEELAGRTTEATQPASILAIELLDKWHQEAEHTSMWGNLVIRGLVEYDQLKAARPDQPELAGWFLTLVSHLARDHYDVRRNEIEATLKEIKSLTLPEPEREYQELLQAKLAHERFLLERRAEHWEVPEPNPQNVDLFTRMNCPWYAAEAALIAASNETPENAAKLVRLAEDQIEVIRNNNQLLAESLSKRLTRYRAIQQDFTHWLQVARKREFRDSKGMVLPEVLVETRPQLMDRVRRGYEDLIAHLVKNGNAEEAFQQAQKAKALSVGRIVEGISEEELTANKLLVQGFGKEKISNQELFVEYYFGPTRAWVFYVFAPQEEFEDLEVRELDPADIRDRCKKIVDALREGRPIVDPGAWLIGKEPPLETLWQRLADWKVKNRNMPRVVIAPDGPICYLPLSREDFNIAASVRFIPTAAVLAQARLLDRDDLELMWTSQRGALVEEDPVVQLISGSYRITLWPNIVITLEM